MKYAVVGVICLAVGAILGAGAPRPAQKWKYDTFHIRFSSDGPRGQIHKHSKEYLSAFAPEDIVSASLSPDGSGWEFFVRVAE